MESPVPGKIRITARGKAQKLVSPAALCPWCMNPLAWTKERRRDQEGREYHACCLDQKERWGRLTGDQGGAAHTS